MSSEHLEYTFNTLFENTSPKKTIVFQLRKAESPEISKG